MLKLLTVIAASLNECLGQSGLQQPSCDVQERQQHTHARMESPSDILSTSLVIAHQARARKYPPSIGANDTHAKHAIGLQLDDKLDKALGVDVGFRARVGSEGTC